MLGERGTSALTPWGARKSFRDPFVQTPGVSPILGMPGIGKGASPSPGGFHHYLNSASHAGELCVPRMTIGERK